MFFLAAFAIVKSHMGSISTAKPPFRRETITMAAGSAREGGYGMTDLDIGLGYPVSLEDLRFQATLLSRVLPNLSVQMRTALSGMYLAVEAR